MAPNLLFLSLSTPATLGFLLELSCYLLGVILIAAMTLTRNSRRIWPRLMTSFKGFKFAWPAVGVRMKGLAINCAVALVVFPLGYFVGRHSVRSNYAKEFEAWKARSIEWQRTYAAFMARHKELNNAN